MHLKGEISNLILVAVGAIICAVGFMLLAPTYSASGEQGVVLDPIGDQSVSEGEVLEFGISANVEGTSEEGGGGDEMTQTWQVSSRENDCFKYWDGEKWNFHLTSYSSIYVGYGASYQCREGGAFRFSGVSIPQGATILSAHLKVNNPGMRVFTPVKSRIEGYDEDDAAVFSTLADLDSRPTTSGSVDWDVEPFWRFEWHDSPDISLMVQEIINRDGWQAGNALALNWQDWEGRSDRNNRHREIYSYNFSGHEDQAAKLEVSWQIERVIPQLNYTVEGLPDGASFENQTFHWIPGYDQAGIYKITFSVSDGTNVASETVTIVVSEVNQAPVISPIGDKTVEEGEPIEFVVEGSDLDGDELSYTVDSLPEGAIFENQLFSWMPDNGQSGSFTLIFTVFDSGGQSDSEVVLIEVVKSQITDNTSPILEDLQIELGSQNMDYTFPLTVAGMISDEGSRVQKVIVKVDGEIVFEENGLNTTQHEFVCHSDIRVRDHVLNVDTRDVAGNESHDVFNIQMVVALISPAL